MEKNITSFVAWECVWGTMPLEELASSYVMGPREEETEKEHPLLTHLKAGSMILDASILYDWCDDHADCFVVRVIIPEGDFVMALLWVVPETIFQLGRSIKNVEWSTVLAKGLLGEM